MKEKLHHLTGCNKKDCWKDAAGVEYHRGNAFGVYRITLDGKISYLNERAKSIDEQVIES